MILGFWILSKALSSPEIWGFKVSLKIWHFCLRFCPYLWPSREITAITKNLPIPYYTPSSLRSLGVIIQRYKTELTFNERFTFNQEQNGSDWNYEMIWSPGIWCLQFPPIQQWWKSKEKVCPKPEPHISNLLLSERFYNTTNRLKLRQCVFDLFKTSS